MTRLSANEVVMRVRECDFARYFRDHHPQVGYLMICSTDEGAYQAVNRNVRMQRTSTLMEGEETCDFRLFGTEQSETQFPPPFP